MNPILNLLGSNYVMTFEDMLEESYRRFEESNGRHALNHLLSLRLPLREKPWVMPKYQQEIEPWMQEINRQFLEYGIPFDLEERTQGVSIGEERTKGVAIGEGVDQPAPKKETITIRRKRRGGAGAKGGGARKGPAKS